ncbi:MAG: DUF4302 domain-containing protein [Mediterranea sp.]|jgi:hypothetical protein|nr:DUF4302 domain-containing protein [Mediterranea sp.]
MKKIYYYLLLGALMLASQSCLHQEEDLFDKSPSERMQEAITKYGDLLKANTAGWVLEYYPEPNQSLGGYNYILQFDGSQVTASSEIAQIVFGEKAPADTTVVSLYEIIPSSGPVLTFDAYNALIHYFSDPSEDKYQADQGDYELIFMGTSEDESEIYLKGTRTGNKMTMRKLPNGETPASYLAKVATIPEGLSKGLAFLIQAGGESVSCTLSDLHLSYQTVGEDEGIVTKTVAYCYTNEGICLYEPITIGGVTAQRFVLGADGLTSVAGDMKISFDYAPNRIFTSCMMSGARSFLWNYSVAGGMFDMSAKAAEWVKAAYNGNLQTNGEALIMTAFTNYVGNPSIRFYSTNGSSTWSAIWGVSIIAVEGTDNQVAFEPGLAPILNDSYYPDCLSMAESIVAEGIYIVEIDDPVAPTVIKFTSGQDPDIWFNVYLQ